MTKLRVSSSCVKPHHFFPWALMTNTCWNPHVRINIFGVRFESLGEAERGTPSKNLIEPLCLIGHFRVPKTLTFKMRPSVQPFLWKWALFVWEWKVISISKAEQLTSFWYRGPGELGNGLLLRLRRNRLFDLLGEGVGVWEAGCGTLFF